MSRNIGKYTTNTSNYLGSGSAGRVEKAKDSEKNVDVVLKSIPKSILKEDEAIQLALVDEIKMFQKLKNPKIVELLDVFQSENTYYMVLEYSSQNLQQYLKKEKMSEKDAVKMLTDLLEGFTELNKHGIIHRGLKLQNIMVHDGVFKLTDCGFTKCLESFRKEQQPLSQFQYLAPQIVNGQKYSNKCDIWSVGIVLFQALYGYLPWFGRTVEEYQHELQHTLLDFPDSREKISNEMKSFLEGCLVIDEEDRFDWDDVYKHKLVSEHFKNYRSQIKQDQIKFLMNEVRQKIIKQNIDVIKLFTELDVNGDKTLEYKELVVLLRKIDKTLSNNDCQIIFKQLDLDGDKTISFDEFAKWLTDNNTKMTLLTRKFHRQSTFKKADTPTTTQQGLSPLQKPQQQPPVVQKPIVPIYTGYVDDPLETNPFDDLNHIRSPEQTILFIKESVRMLGINLFDIFVRFDQNQDGYISFQEFYAMSKTINQALTTEELKVAFRIFDLNEDNFISYKEFNDILNITITRPIRLVQTQQYNYQQGLQGSAPFFGTQIPTQPQPYKVQQQQQMPQQQFNYQPQQYNQPQFSMPQYQQYGYLPSQQSDLSIAQQLIN